MKSSPQNLFAQRSKCTNRTISVHFTHKITLLSFFVFLSFMGFTQTTIITGRVLDSIGAPLQRVTVIPDHSKKPGLTNEEGMFSLPVTASDKKITFSFIGMVPVTKPINGQTNLDATLIPDNTNLGEVVVVGYGGKGQQMFLLYPWRPPWNNYHFIGPSQKLIE